MELKEKNIEDEIIKNIETPIETTSLEDAQKEENTSNIDPISDFKPVKIEKSKKSIMSILGIILGILIIIILVALIGFTGYNALNQNIVSGVHIKDVDVSNLSKSDAKYQVENYIN